MLKKLLIIYLSCLLFSLSAYEWQDKEFVDEMQKITGFEINAIAKCDNKEDMARAARVYNIDAYFYSVHTMDEPVFFTSYYIIFCSDGILGLIYSEPCICEVYWIWN